jgi:hypothetical protein
VGLQPVSRGRRSSGDAFGSSARFRRMGPGGPSTSVYDYGPCHVAAAVPWCLIGSHGHGAARLEDEEAYPENVPSGHNRD